MITRALLCLGAAQALIAPRAPKTPTIQKATLAPAERTAVGGAALKQAFDSAKDDGRASLVGYLTGGYPAKEETVDLLLALEKGGADVIELGVPFTAMSTAEEMCGASDVIYTQTPGSTTCVEKSWLKPHATIICSGSDQPTKQEIPTDILKASKYVSDLTKQTSKVGELRSAIADGSMTEADVYAEIGEVCNGSKPGREGDELIVVDLTGTGAQDAAIGQVAWEKMG